MNKSVWILESGCLFEGGITEGVYETEEKGLVALNIVLKEFEEDYKYVLQEEHKPDHCYHGAWVDVEYPNPNGDLFFTQYINLRKYKVQ